MSRATARACLAVLLASPATTQVFVERSHELGLVHEYVSGFDEVATLALKDYTQQGVSLADLNGDGTLDVVTPGGVGWTRVFLNVGGTFVDATAAAGVNAGEFDRSAGLGDYDGDGDVDLYLAVHEPGAGPQAGRGRLYRNTGSAVFEEVTELGDAAGFGHSLLAKWDDLDRDGLLDLYLCEFLGTPNAWYRNNGDGGFTEMGAAVGLDYGGSTHVIGVADLDRDRLPDVVVCNDFVVSAWAELDQAKDGVLDGTAEHVFTDVSEGSGLATQGGLMGVTVADFNYDGLPDLYKTDVGPNVLLINHLWPGSGLPWTEEAAFYGVANGLVACPDCPSGFDAAVGWACPAFHADKDPWLDLLVVNGKVPGLSAVVPYTPAGQIDALFHGDGPANQFRFTDMSVEFGVAGAFDDRGAALGDVDQDGDLDLFLAPTSGSLRFYENQVDPEDGNWLAVRAQCQTSAPGGAGVEVSYVDSLGYPHLTILGSGGPTASQDDLVAYFGLGEALAVDLNVRFPSGIELTLPGVAANQEITVVEPRIFEIERTTLPIASAVTAGAAAVAGPPVTLPWRGVFAVTVNAHDATGVALDGSADVSIEIPGVAPKGAEQHLGGGTFRRYFLAPKTPQSVRVKAVFDGFAVGIEPQIHFYDPTDLAGTVVQLVPEAVRAGSSDTVEVRIAPKTQDGILIGSGRSVTLDVPPSILLAGPTDLGDGRYRATLKAPVLPGFYSLTAFVDGQPAGTTTLEAGGLPDPGATAFYIETPIEVQASAPHQYRLQITLKDALARRLGPKAALLVTPVPDSGTPPVIVRTDLYGEGQRDGDAIFVLEKPVGTPADAAHGVLEIAVDGVVQGSLPYSF
jgi:hypothetical protein